MPKATDKPSLSQQVDINADLARKRRINLLLQIRRL